MITIKQTVHREELLEPGCPHTGGLGSLSLLDPQAPALGSRVQWTPVWGDVGLAGLAEFGGIALLWCGGSYQQGSLSPLESGRGLDSICYCDIGRASKREAQC